MEGRWIDIESISGEGISSFALPFQKPGLYLVVSVGGRQKQHTSTDPTGTKNPRWDLPMRFDLDGSDQVVEFRLMARGNLLLLRRGKHVGELMVPLSALAAENGARVGSLCHVIYQVRTPAGKVNGLLTFWYRISFPHIDPLQAARGGGYIMMSPSPPSPSQFGYYSSPVYVVQMMPPGGSGYPDPVTPPQSAGTYYQPMMQALLPPPQYGYRP